VGGQHRNQLAFGVAEEKRVIGEPVAVVIHVRANELERAVAAGAHERVPGLDVRVLVALDFHRSNSATPNPVAPWRFPL
jgi:hypothetical protein